MEKDPRREQQMQLMGINDILYYIRGKKKKEEKGRKEGRKVTGLTEMLINKS